MSRFNRLLWSRPSWIWSYGFAFLAIASIWILSRWMTPRFAFPGTLYLCAAMLSVWFGGFGPGLLASVLSTLAYHYYFRHSPDPTLREMPRLLMVFLSNILIVLISAAQRSAKESLRHAHDDLKRTVEDLQRTNEALQTESREREQAEKRLRRSDAYLEQAQQLSHTGSFGWDVSSGDIYWSPETFRIFEFESVEKVTVDLILQRTHPEDRIAVQQLIERIIQQPSSFYLDHRLLMPDGSVKYLRVVGRPSENESGRLEFAGAVTDVSERKLAEQERERSRQLEAELAHINRVTTMGELTASLAHEIKQPIAATVMNAQTCLRWLKHEDPDRCEISNAATRIVEDGKRAGEIIERIRSLYKKSPPKRELVDVNEVIDEIVALLRGEAHRCAVSIRTDLAGDVPRITADRVQVQQVLMNIMLNGIEAMKEMGGVLTVTSQLDPGDQVMISISDTGVGLPAEKADQIFDAFFTTKPQGSGMGLAISRSIVASHGGSLWATANVDRGATFRFTLPTTAAVVKIPAAREQFSE